MKMAEWNNTTLKDSYRIDILSDDFRHCEQKKSNRAEEKPDLTKQKKKKRG